MELSFIITQTRRSRKKMGPGQIILPLLNVVKSLPKGMMLSRQYHFIGSVSTLPRIVFAGDDDGN
jgi:hypothetical protein